MFKFTEQFGRNRNKDYYKLKLQICRNSIYYLSENIDLYVWSLTKLDEIVHSPTNSAYFDEFYIITNDASKITEYKKSLIKEAHKRIISQLDTPMSIERKDRLVNALTCRCFKPMDRKNKFERFNK